MSNRKQTPIHWPQWASDAPQLRLSYWLWLSGSILILLCSWVMSTGDERQVLLPGVGVLPETCTLHTHFGVDCPGCGLTRSFIHLAHGNLRTAWTLSPVGLLLFIYIASQIPLVLNLMWSSRTIENIIDASAVRSETHGETIPAECDEPLEAPTYTAGLLDTNGVRLAWLSRWVRWNQWILVNLMLALVLQWIIKLIRGASWG